MNRERGTVVLCATAWIAASLLFACLRIPYDDEWFSIELALRADGAHFWQALQGDVHPPWLACLDRLLAALWHSRYPLHGIRVLVSAVAFGITAPWMARRLCVPTGIVWLAALHPIVFMYGGAARWYPFLLLAHALRARALWAGDRSRWRHPAFIAGAAIGGVAGYIDALFLAHDCAWWLGAAFKDKRSSVRTTACASAGIAAAVVLALHWVSPLGVLHGLQLGPIHLSAPALLVWAGVGCTGEAGPRWPWLLVGLAVPVVFARALFLLFRDRGSRTFSAYLVATVLAWTAAAAAGASHPRYSLWLWFVISACALPLWRQSRLDRAGLVVAGGYLCVVLGFMAAGRGFYKTDLNDLDSSDCTLLSRAPRPQLVVVPYARLAELVQTRCRIDAPVLRLPSVRIVPDKGEQMQALDAALRAGPHEVWLLQVNAQSSLIVTNQRVRATLSQRCTSISSAAFGALPHRLLKHALTASQAATRFLQERWSCP